MQQRSPFVVVPGWGGSGPHHWQSLWEAELDAVRMDVPEWSSPDREIWAEALETALAAIARRTSRPPVLLAHSLGCITVAHWARKYRRPIRAALLVAPADVERAPSLPSLRAFGPIPDQPLPFSSHVVVSDDDPHVTLGRAGWFATRWGSELDVVPGGGHLNTASGHGPWPDGRQLLAKLLRRTQLARTG